MVDIFLKKLKEETHNNKKQIFAAFDADGTLWPGDVGRGFFRFLIQKKYLIKKFPNLQESFDRIVEQKGRKHALVWLAQILSGFKLTEVREWVKQFFIENPLKAFLINKCIIEFLHSKNIPVYIVSSSIQWVLEEALKTFNIPTYRIIGVQTIIQNEMITDKLILPAPVHEDKIKALHKKTNGENPFLASGNTPADLSLLEASSHFKLVIASAKTGDDKLSLGGNRIYSLEKKLVQIAKDKKWFYLEDNLELIYPKENSNFLSKSNFF